MSPLMQTIFEYLFESGLGPYIDTGSMGTLNDDVDRLNNALNAALPPDCRGLLEEYRKKLRARSLLEIEAMFQAAFAAARELA